jgi:V/A-type H+-transporting ATPase subunit E
VRPVPACTQEGPTMGLEKVVEEVMSSGKRRRDEILQEADDDAKQLLEAARKEVAEYRQQREKENRTRIERMRTQDLQTAELEVRRLELAMRRDQLEHVQEVARERLRTLDRPQNEAMLKALLSGREFPGAKVFSAAKDEALVRALTHMTYGGHVDCIGGVVIETSDSAIREDLTYDALLRERSEELLPMIAEILFGEGD